jgi:chitodextrinase
MVTGLMMRPESAARCAAAAPSSPPPARPSRTGRARGWLALLLAAGLSTVAGSQAGQTDPIRIQSSGVLQGSVWMEWQGGQPPYRIQAATDEQFRWQDVSPFLFDTWYFGPTRGSFAFFRVRSESDEVPPLAPAGLTVSATRCDGVALSWLPASDGPTGSGIDHYRIYRDGAFLGLTEGGDTLFLDRTVVPETPYAYSVSAVDRLGNESVPAAPVRIATEPCLGESGPLTELTLEWDPGEERDVAGYLVYWGLHPGEYQWVMDTMTDTVATVTELSAGTTYFFAVTAYDRDGIQSDPSPEIGYIIP